MGNTHETPTLNIKDKEAYIAYCFRELVQRVGGRDKAAQLMGVGMTTVYQWKRDPNRIRIYPLLRLLAEAKLDTSFLLTDAEQQALKAQAELPSAAPVKFMPAHDLEAMRQESLEDVSSHRVLPAPDPQPMIEAALAKAIAPQLASLQAEIATLTLALSNLQNLQTTQPPKPRKFKFWSTS